jgi:hypothetical protein
MTQTNHLPDVVEEMLLDAGQTQNAGLRAALLALGSLASLPAPAPSGKLAVLLAESEAGSSAGPGEEDGSSEGADELVKRRRLRAHRPTVVGLALIAGMGLGVGGVAASSPVPGHSGNLSIQHLLEDWAPAWSLPVPHSHGSVLPPIALDGRGVEATVQSESQPGHRDGNAPGLASAETVPAVEQSAVPPGIQESAAPKAPVELSAGEAEAPKNRQRAATDSGKIDAGAVGRENEGAAAGLPEQAVGRGAGAQGEANREGTVPRVRKDVLPGVLRQGVDAGGAAVEAVPEAKWLQKFVR